MQRIRIKYKKKDKLRFVGHLDLIRIIERAVRRSSIPIAYSKGYNPKMKISFGVPLGLGIVSDAEFADFEIDGWINPSFLMQKLNSSFPDGLEIIEARIISENEDSLSIKTYAIEYFAEIDYADKKLEERILDVLNSKEILVKRKKENEEKSVDIRPLIVDLKLEKDGLRFIVRAGKDGTVRPDEILNVLGIEEARVKRVAQYENTPDGLKPL